MDYVGLIPGESYSGNSQPVTATSSTTSTSTSQTANPADAPGSGMAVVMSMGQLETLAPALYEAVQKSIYTEIKRSQKRLTATLHRINQENKSR